VPSVLLNRDVADCCREHLAKLAGIVLRCADAFPYHCCPRRALTPEGVDALALDLNQVDAALGYPSGWTDIAVQANRNERIASLRMHVDEPDFAAIKRLTRRNRRLLHPSTADRFGEELAASFVGQIERRRNAIPPTNPVLGSLGEVFLRSVIARGEA